MPIAYDSLRALLDHGFDTVIDVRSPAEYAEDHIPGAVNMPALSNAERAQVGTIYKQLSAFEAKKVGATMVARNAASAIEQHMADRDGAWKPLVYCWRGGQRSGSFASILKQIGWRTDTIQGGYQTYRRLVHAAVYDTPLQARVVLLGGNTGTAKTDILQRLGAFGVQVVDLEGLANHRGSLLGEMPAGQPSQKAFESRLAVALAALDPTRPVVMEAESSKIGRLVVPPVVWAAMCAAQRIEITAPLPARAAYLTTTYADIIADPDRLRARLQPIRRHRGNAIVDGWEAHLATGDHLALATALMVDHYDPAYAKSRATHDSETLAQVHVNTLDLSGQTEAAAAIAALLRQP